jgi:hypothetical protein
MKINFTWIKWTVLSLLGVAVVAVTWHSRDNVNNRAAQPQKPGVTITEAPAQMPAVVPVENPAATPSPIQTTKAQDFPTPVGNTDPQPLTEQWGPAAPWAEPLPVAAGETLIPAPAVPVAEGQADNVGFDVLTRGPLHEAFMGPDENQDGPVMTAPRQSPAPVAEVPPDEKPDDPSALWIGGYWSWDDERNDFVNISFIPTASSTARTAPPAITPVPGEAGRSKTTPAAFAPAISLVKKARIAARPLAAGAPGGRPARSPRCGTGPRRARALVVRAAAGSARPELTHYI